MLSGFFSSSICLALSVTAVSALSLEQDIYARASTASTPLKRSHHYLSKER